MKFFIIIFLYLSNILVIKDNCDHFKILGIKSICLNIDKNNFLKHNNNKAKKIHNDYADLGYEKFEYTEKIKVEDEIKEIKYFYFFKNNKLVAYSFEFLGNRELFRKIIIKLNKSKPELIKNECDKIRYNFSNKKSIIHFSLTNKYGKNQYISGGEKLIL